MHKYNDFILLTNWLDNQKNFEHHKKNLNEIKKKEISTKQKIELGLEGSTIKTLKERMRYASNNLKFQETEKEIEVRKYNKILFQKLLCIKNRKNEILNNKESFELKLPKIQEQKESFRQYRVNIIKKENESLDKRITQKHSTVDYKKYLNDFENHCKYKKIIKRPEIVNLVLETSPNRRISLKFKKSSRENSPEHETNVNKSILDEKSYVQTDMNQSTNVKATNKHRKLASMDQRGTFIKDKSTSEEVCDKYRKKSSKKPSEAYKSQPKITIENDKKDQKDQKGSIKEIRMNSNSSAKLEVDKCVINEETVQKEISRDNLTTINKDVDKEKTVSDVDTNNLKSDENLNNITDLGINDINLEE